MSAASFDVLLSFHSSFIYIDYVTFTMNSFLSCIRSLSQAVFTWISSFDTLDTLTGRSPRVEATLLDASYFRTTFQVPLTYLNPSLNALCCEG